MTIGSRRVRREFSSLSSTWVVSHLVFCGPQANLNTFFNLLLGLAALTLLSPISRLLTFLIESPVIDDSREPDSYLDPLLLQAPSLALNQAAREELRLLDEIKLMLRTVWTMIWGKNVRLISKVEEHQRRIEGTQEELKDYLSQISDENLSEEDVAWKFIVLDYSQELTVTSIAYAMVRDSKHPGVTAGHGPELEVEEAW